MNTQSGVSGIFRTVLLLVILSGTVTAHAEGNPVTEKYAWAENAGWVNFFPVHGGMTVYPDHLSGYVWQENLGWLKLGADGGGHYDNTTAANWGVNRDGSGRLSGYAWSEGWGWVNFGPPHGGVTIDPATNSFAGSAWAENFGWISFRSPPGAAVEYGVSSAVAFMPGDVNSDRVVDVFDALLTLQYSVGLYQPPDLASFKLPADVAPLESSTGKPKGNDTVDVFDALAILRHAVGLDPW